MNRHALRAALAASLAAGGLLAGCGGDSDMAAAPPPPPPSNEMPTSAVATDASLEAFAIGLAASETADPLLLDNVTTFPTSETEEPIAVN